MIKAIPPVVIPHSYAYFSCSPQKKRALKYVGTDASFSAMVQVGSVPCKSACLTRARAGGGGGDATPMSFSGMAAEPLGGSR